MNFEELNYRARFERQRQLSKLKQHIKEHPRQSMVAILGFQVAYGSLTEEDSKFLKE